MSSWEGEPDAHDRRPSDGDDRGGAPARPAGEASAITPDLVLPAPHGATALGLVPSDERGVDPLPSTGSLVWAPDPTEPVPVVAADPAEGPPGRPDWPDPSGAPLSATGVERSADQPAVARHAAPAYPGRATPPTSPAYAGQHARPPRFARRPPRPAHGDGAAPRSPNGRVLALLAGGVALIVAVAALVLLPGGDGSDDPGESSSGSTPVVGGDATDPAGPFVGPTGVVGSWSGSEWLPRPDGEQPGAGLEYTVVGLDEVFDTARGEATDEDCAEQRATSETDVAVDLGADGDGPPALAVAGVAEPRPRAVEQWNPDAPLYRQAATDVAAGLGAATPPTLTQLLRADLDGNGTDEIVVAAEHIADPAGLTPTAGDWSVVFLRRVVGDGVATDVLASSVVGGGGPSAGDTLERIQVATLADLNRDGAMEVALAGRSATGGWTSIHALGDDGVPSEVLRAGCED
jgi:hypothetical protein